MSTLHFRVDFAGVTELARQFWAERQYVKAFEFLEDGFGFTKEQSAALLAGKLRMAQDPQGTEGCDGLLVADSWDFKSEGYLIYPDPTAGPALAEENSKLKEEIEDLSRQLHSHKEALLVVDGKPTRRKFTDIIYDLAPPIPGESFEERVQRQNFAMGAQIQAKEFEKHLLTQDSKPTPKPTVNYKEFGNGWVLPNGKFYPCDTPMLHIWLAERLGKTEKQAEDCGWVKLSTSVAGIRVYSKQKPSQKQLDVVFDWAQKHSGRESAMESWLGK